MASSTDGLLHRVDQRHLAQVPQRLERHRRGRGAPTRPWPGRSPPAGRRSCRGSRGGRGPCPSRRARGPAPGNCRRTRRATPPPPRRRASSGRPRPRTGSSATGCGGPMLSSRLDTSPFQSRSQTTTRFSTRAGANEWFLVVALAQQRPQRLLDRPGGGRRLRPDRGGGAPLALHAGRPPGLTSTASGGPAAAAPRPPPARRCPTRTRAAGRADVQYWRIGSQIRHWRLDLVVAGTAWRRPGSRRG